MHPLSLSSRLLAGTVVPLLFGAALTYAATGEPYSDEWIRGRISGAFAYTTSLDSSNLEVRSVGGDVTLSGAVPTLIEHDFAEEVARATDGVRSVKNEIKVDETLSKKSRSGFRQKLRDAAITASVKSRLIANKDTGGMNIGVSTEANAVTLSGNVSSDREKVLAGEIAARSSGVRTVANELTVVSVSPAKSSSGGPDAESKDENTGSDAWITAKVRTLLAFDDGTAGCDVEVTTKDGVVSLTGNCRSEGEKDLVLEHSREVKGVASLSDRLTVGK